MSDFKRISDKKVIHVWGCKDCNVEFEIPPTFYEEAGEPICNRCNRDMKYIETKIKVPRVMVFLEAGIVHDVMADSPAILRFIDYDTEGSDNIQKIHLVDKDNKLCKETHCVHIIKKDMDGIEDLEPFFKQKAIK